MTSALGISHGLSPYLTVCPSSRPNMDTVWAWLGQEILLCGIDWVRPVPGMDWVPGQDHSMCLLVYYWGEGLAVWLYYPTQGVRYQIIPPTKGRVGSSIIQPNRGEGVRSNYTSHHMRKVGNLIIPHQGRLDGSPIIPPTTRVGGESNYSTHHKI